MFSHRTSRPYTSKLLDMAEEGSISWEQLARDALGYMSEADVKQFARSNDFIQDDPGEEGNPVYDAYSDGVCPDCGEEIPDNIEEGEDCTNCGHTFHAARSDD